MVVDQFIPMHTRRLTIETALGGDDTIALGGDPKAGQAVFLRTTRNLYELAVENLVYVKTLNGANDKMLPVGMRQDMNRSVSKQRAINHFQLGEARTISESIFERGGANFCQARSAARTSSLVTGMPLG